MSDPRTLHEMVAVLQQLGVLDTGFEQSAGIERHVGPELPMPLHKGTCSHFPFILQSCTAVAQQLGTTSAVSLQLKGLYGAQETVGVEVVGDSVS